MVALSTNFHLKTAKSSNKLTKKAPRGMAKSSVFFPPDCCNWFKRTPNNPDPIQTITGVRTQTHSSFLGSNPEPEVASSKGSITIAVWICICQVNASVAEKTPMIDITQASLPKLGRSFTRKNTATSVASIPNPATIHPKLEAVHPLSRIPTIRQLIIY